MNKPFMCIWKTHTHVSWSIPIQHLILPNLLNFDAWNFIFWSSSFCNKSLGWALGRALVILRWVRFRILNLELGLRPDPGQARLWLILSHRECQQITQQSGARLMRRLLSATAGAVCSANCEGLPRIYDKTNPIFFISPSGAGACSWREWGRGSGDRIGLEQKTWTWSETPWNTLLKS